MNLGPLTGTVELVLEIGLRMELMWVRMEERRKLRSLR